jgi:hypothetical protein
VEVSEQVLAKHGKALTKEAHAAALGKRPLDCWRDVAAILELNVPAEQLFNETEPLLQARCDKLCAVAVMLCSGSQLWYAVTPSFS